MRKTGKTSWLLLGVILAGCFVPVAYGVYVVYEDATSQVVTVRVKEKPDELYRVAIAAIEERKISKITKRDDAKRIISVQKDDLAGYVKIDPLTARASTLTLHVQKGKDPEGERKLFLGYILDVCKRVGIECTEEAKK